MFTPGVDQGLVTYDSSNELQTVDWKALVLGLQYHAPFGLGKKLWASALFSWLRSDNVVSLTPLQGRPYVFSDAKYLDGNLFFSPTPSSQIGLSVQWVQQTFGDRYQRNSYDTSSCDQDTTNSCYGIQGHNVRGELAVYYFF
jgi:hypothetical protein